MVVSSTIISSPRQRTMRASQRLRLSGVMVALLLLALLFHLAEALDAFAVAEVLELEQLAHLELRLAAVDRRVGEAPRPLHRLLARLHLDQGVARDQLLRLGERPVDHGALRSRVLHAPAGLAGLESRGVEQHARLLQLLMVFLHLVDQLLCGHHALLAVLRGLHDHHEPHGLLLQSGSRKSLLSTLRRPGYAKIDTPPKCSGAGA